MNNNTIVLDKYLQDELNTEELAAFKSRLNNDAALRDELQLQLKIIESIYTAGVKNEFTQAFNSQRRLKKIFQWCLLLIIIVAAVIFFHHLKDHLR